MFLKRFFLAFVVSMFAFSASVEAKTVTLTAEDHGVLGAMYHAGCTNQYWLKRTLLLSGIVSGQEKRLPEGTPIVIPDECINGDSPNRADIEGTRSFFASQFATQDFSKLQTVIADLTNKLHAAEVTIANLNITIVNLKHQLAFVSQPAKAPFESRPEDQGRMRKWQIAFSSASLIAITTLLFSWASGHKLTELHEKCENLEHKNVVVENEKYQLQAENSELQESNIVLQGQYDSLEQVYQADKVALSILYHGEMYTFPDTTDRTVACPVVGCSEKKIKMDHANMRQHLDKHPRLRLKEVSSHVMRSRLGLPAVRVLSLA